VGHSIPVLSKYYFQTITDMNLTNKFSLDKVKDILLVSLKDINNMELLTESVSRDVSEEYGDFTFSAGGEAGIKIYLFNDPEDDNNDAVAASLGLDQEIEKGFAFVSYELLGKVKGGLKGDLEFASLGLSIVNEISHKSYLKHQNSKTLAQAVANDVIKFKVAFDWDSIANLEDSEAISVWSKGALDFNADVSVSDTFTPVLSGISKLLGAVDGIGVKMDMSASLKVRVNIADFFQTIIQRRDVNGKKSYNVSIQKESKNSRQIAGAIGVTAGITNPEVLTAAIDNIINKGEKRLGTELEKLKGKTWNKLSPKEQALAEVAAKTVGLDIEKIKDDFLKKYNEKKESIVAKIKTIVESELKFSVSYSYERLKESQALLKGVFSEAALKSNFKNVLRLQVPEIFNYAKDNPKEAKVNEYFDLTRISIIKSTKIGFSISDFELSQLVKKTVELEDKVILNSETREELQSVRFSAAKFTAEKLGVFKERENSMTISGSYNGAAKPDVFMSNLDYEFALHWAESYKNPKDAHVRKLVDFATTWGIISEKSFDEHYNVISELLKDRKKIRVAVFLKMKEGVFDSLVDPIVGLSDLSFQQNLAASVPYADYEGRRTPSERRDLYFSFFNFYLKQNNGSNIDFDKAKLLIVDHLGKNNKPKLAQFEEFGDNRYTPLNRLLEHNFMAFKFDRFKTAIALLNDSRKSFESIVKAPEFHSNLNSIRLQPEFNMRFLGRLLSQLAVEKGIDDVVERSLTIDYKDDKEKDNKFVLAR
jgi:hypothetical protein